jgi:hypothetical protein
LPIILDLDTFKTYVLNIKPDPLSEIIYNTAIFLEILIIVSNVSERLLKTIKINYYKINIDRRGIVKLK